MHTHTHTKPETLFMSPFCHILQYAWTCVLPSKKEMNNWTFLHHSQGRYWSPFPMSSTLLPIAERGSVLSVKTAPPCSPNHPQGHSRRHWKPGDAFKAILPVWPHMLTLSSLGTGPQVWGGSPTLSRLLCKPGSL